MQLVHGTAECFRRSDEKPTQASIFTDDPQESSTTIHGKTCVRKRSCILQGIPNLTDYYETTKPHFDKRISHPFKPLLQLLLSAAPFLRSHFDARLIPPCLIPCTHTMPSIGGVGPARTTIGGIIVG
jgi:hypothetical protein